jgi:myo-inositol 2-dehydrogenase / D-chiro-inositol 1-dehydrogenase
MRIGLIGVGRIGAFHAGTLGGLAEVDSLVVTDADPERAREVGRQVGAEVAGSVPELLGAGVDAIVIASSTGSRPELIKLGIQAGLPVFCEKPVAPDVEGTLDVIKAASGGATRVQIELAAFTEVAAGQMASPCTLEDALETFYVAEACELSRQRRQPVAVAEVRW